MKIARGSISLIITGLVLVVLGGLVAWRATRYSGHVEPNAYHTSGTGLTTPAEQENKPVAKKGFLHIKQLGLQIPITDITQTDLTYEIEHDKDFDMVWIASAKVSKDLIDYHTQHGELEERIGQVGMLVTKDEDLDYAGATYRAGLGEYGLFSWVFDNGNFNHSSDQQYEKFEKQVIEAIKLAEEL